MFLAHDAGTVDDRVDGAGIGNDRAHRAPDLLVIRNVAGRRQPIVRRIAPRANSAGVRIEDRDTAAAGRERRDTGAANPTATPA